jgi:cell division septation protein DedD
LREQPGGVTAVALTEEGKVLALPDQTFLTAPYNSFADNDLFIDHIIGFLLSGERDFDLIDFPNFFSQTVRLVHLESSLLQENFTATVALREALEAARVNVFLDDNYTAEEPLVLISDYGTIDAGLRNRLIGDGVFIELSGGQITVNDIGSLERGGSVLFHLHVSEAGVYQLFILSDGNQALRRGLALLLEGGLGECLLQPDTALCTPATFATPTPSPTPTETASPTSDGSETPTPDGSTTSTPTPAGTTTGTPEGTPSPEATPTPTPGG